MRWASSSSLGPSRPPRRRVSTPSNPVTGRHRRHGRTVRAGTGHDISDFRERDWPTTQQKARRAWQSQSSRISGHLVNAHGDCRPDPGHSACPCSGPCRASTKDPVAGRPPKLRVPGARSAANGRDPGRRLGDADDRARVGGTQPTCLLRLALPGSTMCSAQAKLTAHRYPCRYHVWNSHGRHRPRSTACGTRARRSPRWTRESPRPSSAPAEGAGQRSRVGV
jgi:hypothetical protein